MDDLEQIIAEALEDWDRVNFGRWRLRSGEETIMSPFSTAEVAHSVAKHIREAQAEAE